MVEQFMAQVHGLFISKQDSYKLFETNAFHTYVQSEADKLYDRVRAQYGHLLNEPKFHSDLGSTDAGNPHGLYDHELTGHTEPEEQDL